MAGDKFMPGMNLKQPGFTYSAWGPFTKNKARIQKFKETGLNKIVDGGLATDWSRQVVY